MCFMTTEHRGEMRRPSKFDTNMNQHKTWHVRGTPLKNSDIERLTFSSVILMTAMKSISKIKV